METWKLLLITLLSAVLLGCLLGVVIGKQQLKRKRPDYKPLLTNKERIIYLVSILVGAACIAFGLLYTPASPDNMEDVQWEDGMMMEEEGTDSAEAAPGGGGVVRRGSGGGVVVQVG